MKISTMATLPSLPSRSHTTAPKNTQRDGGVRLNINPLGPEDMALTLKVYVLPVIRSVMKRLGIEAGPPPLQDKTFSLALIEDLRKKGLVSELTDSPWLGFGSFKNL
jgi:hypothetical protein